MSWNTSAREQLERISTSLRTAYRFDQNLLSEYSRMMGDAVRTGDEPVIICFAWFTAIEAARFLDNLGLYDPQELEDILVSKQHDYGHDNINAFGQVGIAVRLSDKIARYHNLTGKKKQAKNEPLFDCLKDMVGYGVISAMLADNTFNEQLEDDSNDPF